MTKKTRLIEFNYEKYKAGAKAVCRNRDLTIANIYPRGSERWRFLVVFHNKEKHHDTVTVNERGYCNSINETTKWDVLLEEEIEEHTFYVNVYNSGATGILKNIEQANLLNTFSNETRLGVLKVTYTDEDLIK